MGLDPQEGLHSATKTCSSGTSRRVALRQQALKRWQRTVAVGDSLPSQLSRQQSRRERSSGKKRELAGARDQRQIQLPWVTTSSHAATVTGLGSAVRGSASTATAGAATLPRTDIYGRKLHCLPRQTDANKIASGPIQHLHMLQAIVTFSRSQIRCHVTIYVICCETTSNKTRVSPKRKARVNANMRLILNTIHLPAPYPQKTIYKMTQISKQWLILKKSQLH